MKLITQKYLEREYGELTKPRRLKRRRGGGGVDWSKFAFGYEIDSTDVVVSSGKVYDGTNSYTASEQTLAMAAGTNEIYIEYEFGVGATIKSAASLPTSGDVNFIIHLYTFENTDGSVSITKTHWIGDFYLPGTFGVR